MSTRPVRDASTLQILHHEMEGFIVRNEHKENGDTGEKLCAHLSGQDEVRESGAVDTGELVQDR